MKEKGKFKGKLKKWFQEDGKHLAGKVLQIGGELTGQDWIESVGKNLLGDPDVSKEDKETIKALKDADLRELEIIERNLTDRWIADVSSDNKLAKTARPLTLHFISLLLLSYFITGYFGIHLPSEYTSLLIVIVPTVYGGYFALREFGKHSQRKNK
jgi:hypothetical protein|tara:strand:- start:301 stop:768 length:468 start_codon:yes stop_codon:yes gene_type:complete